MKKIYQLLGTAALVLGFTACTGDFESMNTDPSAVTDCSPAYTLPTVEELVSNVDCTPYQRGDNLYAQMYCQYFANLTQGWTSDRYGYNDGWASPGYWEPYYLALKHLRVLSQTIGNHPEYANYYSMMRIIMAYGTIVTTDNFGDIPYSEAGYGTDGPKYDAQKDIYTAVFKELTEAVNQLKEGATDQAECSENNDLIYSGDVSKWIRFANSLRLRYALRISFIDPETAKKEGEAALQSGVMESTDDLAGVRCTATGSWGVGHPLYVICDWDCFAMSKTFMDYMKKLSSVTDPRMTLWAGQTRGWVNNKGIQSKSFKGEQYEGLPNGLSDDQLLKADADGYKPYAADNVSMPWGLRAFPNWNTAGDRNEVDNNCGTITNIPLKLMAYSEVCFLKAEAALRGWSGADDAKADYEAGIRASFAEARSGVDASLYSTANDDAYMSGSKVAWNDGDTFEQKLEKIITQKWIALYPNGNEAWAECRRTGYPKLNPISSSVDNTINPANNEFVKKIRYTDAERRDNPHATESTLNQNQGDGMNVRVWWDTKRYN